jgi:hypothetical protein
VRFRSPIKRTNEREKREGERERERERRERIEAIKLSLNPF